jgi:hypothetical protein
VDAFVFFQILNPFPRLIVINYSSELIKCVDFSLAMEEANTSETSVNFYQTTRRNIPADNNLHTCRRENLKSHIFKKLITFTALSKAWVLTSQNPGLWV